jgi:lysylphosphatidylglycerol synthetase-like protein (DUF2156 family)
MDTDSRQNTAPTPVRVAALLLFASVALRIVDFISRIGHHTARSYVVWAGSTVLLLLFAFAFLRGKNWARWVYLFILVSAAFAFFQRGLPRSTFSTVYLCVQTLLQIISAILVFLRPSNDWFKRVISRNSLQTSAAASDS